MLNSFEHFNTELEFSESRALHMRSTNCVARGAAARVGRPELNTAHSLLSEHVKHIQSLTGHENEDCKTAQTTESVQDIYCVCFGGLAVIHWR